MRGTTFLLALVFSCGLSAQISVGPNPPDGDRDKHYSHTFTASGGTAPYTYFVTSPPFNLSMNQTTGELSGVLSMPVIGETHSFTVTAIDSLMQQGQQQFTITVNNPRDTSKDGNALGCTSSKTGVLGWALLLSFAGLLAAPRQSNPRAGQ